ncbi:hypothetical protein MNBD_GAMMA06-1945 [hydrothermal vent metagenome]|uniref:Flagellar protein FlgN n=1 Tax=hydrothermal vent metagenome TaxID=652676 RepID=A0A3B0WKN8_9ZZZZ
MQQLEIKQIFQKEIECAGMLFQSLIQEYEALAKHHADALEEVVRVKQERINQLELISGQREKLLASFKDENSKIKGDSQESDDQTNNDQKSNDQKSNDQASNYYQFGDNKELTALWDELVNVAEKCRDKNRVNGSIVKQVSRQSRHALDILHGILPGGTAITELYDNTGQATKLANKRSLVQV